MTLGEAYTESLDHVPTYAWREKYEAAHGSASPWVSILQDYPEFASRLGILLATFSAVESALPDVVARLLGTTEVAPRTILGEIPSFGMRLDILKQLTKSQGTRPSTKIVYGFLHELFREALHLRNKYAHAGYGVGDGFLHLQRSPGDYNRKPHYETKSLADLDADIKRMGIIAAQTRQFGALNVLPRAIIDKANEACDDLDP